MRGPAASGDRGDAGGAGRLGRAQQEESEARDQDSGGGAAGAEGLGDLEGHREVRGGAGRAERNPPAGRLLLLAQREGGAGRRGPEGGDRPGKEAEGDFHLDSEEADEQQAVIQFGHLTPWKSLATSYWPGPGVIDLPAIDCRWPDKNRTDPLLLNRDSIRLPLERSPITLYDPGPGTFELGQRPFLRQVPNFLHPLFCRIERTQFPSLLISPTGRQLPGPGTFADQSLDLSFSLTPIEKASFLYFTQARSPQAAGPGLFFLFQKTDPHFTYSLPIPKEYEGLRISGSRQAPGPGNYLAYFPAIQLFLPQPREVALFQFVVGTSQNGGQYFGLRFLKRWSFENRQLAFAAEDDICLEMRSLSLYILVTNQLLLSDSDTAVIILLQFVTSLFECVVYQDQQQQIFYSVTNRSNLQFTRLLVLQNIEIKQYKIMAQKDQSQTITLTSWEHDLLVKVNHNQSVAKIMTLVSNALNQSKKRIVFQANSKKLSPFSTFYQAGISSSDKVFIKMIELSDTCKHGLYQYFQCLNCNQKQRLCQQSECLKKHIHNQKIYFRAILFDKPQLDKNQVAQILLTFCFNQRINVFASIVEHMHKTMKSSLVRALREKVMSARRLLSLSSSAIKDAAGKMEVQSHIFESLRYFLLLNKYFERNIKLDQKSLIVQGFRASKCSILNLLFIKIFTIEKMVFEAIVPNCTLNPKVKSNSLRLEQFHSLVVSKIDQSLAADPEHDHGQESKYSRLCKRAKSIRRKAWYKKVNHFLYTFRISKQHFQLVKNRYEQSTFAFGPLASAFTLNIVAQSEGYCSAELRFNNQRVLDEQVRKALQSSDLSAKVKSLLSYQPFHDLYFQVFARLLNWPQYKSSVQFLNDTNLSEGFKTLKKLQVESLDLLLCVSRDHSAQKLLNCAKDLVPGLFEQFQSQYGSSFLRVGVILFADHSENKVLIKSPLTFGVAYEDSIWDAQLAKNDCAAMPDLIQAVNQTQFRANSSKLVVLVSNLPPHGEKFNEGILHWQDCPCGKSLEQGLRELKQEKLGVMLLTTSVRLTKLQQEFRQNTHNFEFRLMQNSAQLKREVKSHIKFIVEGSKEVKQTWRLEKTLRFIVKLVALEISYFNRYWVEIQLAKEFEQFSKGLAKMVGNKARTQERNDTEEKVKRQVMQLLNP